MRQLEGSASAAEASMPNENKWMSFVLVCVYGMDNGTEQKTVDECENSEMCAALPVIRALHWNNDNDIVNKW